LKNATLVAAVATSEPMISTNAREISLEGGRLRVVLATVVINVVAVSLLTFAPRSDWRTGAALNIVDNCLLVSFALVNIVEITFLRRYSSPDGIVCTTWFVARSIFTSFGPPLTISCIFGAADRGPTNYPDHRLPRFERR
jgi:hypothetical protein